jgi:hypothetical protein
MQKVFILCPHSSVSSFDSGYFETAGAEVEPLNDIQCDMLEELKFGRKDRGMGTEEWGQRNGDRGMGTGEGR